MHWCYAYEMKFHLQIYSVILKLGPGANAPIAPWVIRYWTEENQLDRRKTFSDCVCEFNVSHPLNT